MLLQPKSVVGRLSIFPRHPTIARKGLLWGLIPQEYRFRGLEVNFACIDIDVDFQSLLSN